RSLVSRAGIVDSGIRLRRGRICRIVRRVGRAVRKVTLSLLRGRDDSFQVDRILLANLFHIDKKEGLVFLERSAEGKPILIADVIRFFTSVEEVSGIKVGPLSIPPTAAVK